MKLEDAIQLHEAIHVWYDVTGYVAELQTHDGSKSPIVCHGETPEHAIAELKLELDKITNLAALRSL